jgi:cysteinyl-tRNA synthetase
VTLKIYNTLTRRKEEFVPLNPPTVRMYNCGPTVYDYFHIGNARNFVIADVIRRYLRFKGYQVQFVQNITDIDDKIINKARAEGCTTEEIAQKYTCVYFEQADRLAIQRADLHPKATDHIPQMLTLISTLLDRGHAYVVDGDVFFRISSYTSYGALSGKNPDDLLEGARVEVDPRKENPLDFALWKASKEDEPSWESPWGAGRPGWHIECSVMAMEHLSKTIDIHSGGADLIFPHHENERAQSESATGQPFVRYWLHNGFLNINKEKMSKSLGNFFTIDQVLERYDPATVRLFLLSAHYRHPLDFSDENLQEAESACQRITDCLVTIDKLINLWKANAQSEVTRTEPPSGLTARGQRFSEAFCEVMDDDFNTARAQSVIFDLVADINLQRKELPDVLPTSLLDERYVTLAHCAKVLEELLSILGLQITGPRLVAHDDMTERLIALLIRIRSMARERKHWDVADTIRQRLQDMGIHLEDHPQGTIWKKQ